MYMTVPPGYVVPLGGSGVHNLPVALSGVPAVAAANQDSILQWYYLNNLNPPEKNAHRRYEYELLWYDPTLEPVSPEGRMPHGKVYDDNGMCVSSRTDWNPRTTFCVVYGKGGPGYQPHGHQDIGQVCINGYDQRLIVDLQYGGSWQYWQGVLAHNVLMFDGEEMRLEAEYKAKLLCSEFDDNRGGYWAFDTTALYDDHVKSVRRTVVHLYPGIVAVLDDAELNKPRLVSLRWHTISKVEADSQGRFLVLGNEGAHLASQVVRIDEGPIAVAGRVQVDEWSKRRREPMSCELCEATLKDEKCRILSLFCVFAPGVKPNAWYQNKGVRSIETPDGRVDVQVEKDKLIVTNRNNNLSWQVAV